MSGFNYCGISSENIIDVPLQIVFLEGIDSLGINRSKIEGDRTISRMKTNEYGTIYDPLSFNMTIMKADKSIFTENEQVIIDRWLTSPKLSSELQIINCAEDSYSYFGLFTTTNYEIGDGGLCLCTLTFSVNGAYPFKHYVKKYTASVYNDDGELAYVNDEFDIILNCETDELEEYVYPVIKIKPISEDFDANSSFVWTSITDNNNHVGVDTKIKSTICMDCQNCMLTEYGEGVTEDVYINVLKYRDIGWQDIGNIYWPRLVAGENRIHIEGHVEVEISYYTTFKKIGGWLV